MNGCFEQLVFLDIRMALKLWLRTAIPDELSAKEKFFLEPENTMILLYGIVDLLSLKVSSFTSRPTVLS